MQRIDVLHLISSLGSGGAEGMLTRLAIQQQRAGLNVAVIHFGENTTFNAKLLSNAGISVYTMQLTSKIHVLSILLRLCTTAYSLKPRVLQSWMYHADCLTILLRGVLGRRVKIFWNVRNTDIPQQGWSITRLIIFINSFFSYLIPTKIIYCAERARFAHEKKSFNTKKSRVIPNGFFFAGKIKKRDFQLKGTVTIGMLARYDYLKNQEAFIKLMDKLIIRGTKKYFGIIQGNGVDVNENLINLLKTLKLTDHVQLLGHTNDIDRFFDAIDMLVIPSRSEGFPNVAIEAIGRGCPVVGFDVGDLRMIVKNEECVVKINDLDQLLHEIEKYFDLPKNERTRLSEENLSHVISKFSIEKIEKEYRHAYQI